MFCPKLATQGQFINKSIRDLQEIIKPKNVAAGYARRHIFGFYMDYLFLGVP
jgi:hypothetical protein